MSRNRNERMRYRYGICLNESCSKCRSKEVQQIPARKDLVCAECEKPLRECPPPRSFGDKYGKLVGIAAGVLIVGGIITGIALSSSDDEKTVAPIVIEETAAVVDTVEVVTEPADTVVPEAEAEEIVTVQTDTIVPEETAEEVVASVAPEKTPAPASASSSSHKLGYGQWNGGWKNGKPHGNGTLTYSTAHLIDSRDPKQRVAQPGEYIVGEWDNGNLVQGRWFKNDGTKEAIIIGKAG